MNSKEGTKEVTLICGYKRSGKDTLLYDCHNMSPNDINKKWIVYQRWPYVGDVPMIWGSRVSFADKLKTQVLEELGMPMSTDTESIKDRVIEDGKTFRDYLIEAAARERVKDPEYWIKKALQGCDKEYIAITDWRYPNELSHFTENGYRVKTFRVFRHEIKVPDPDDATERSLDRVETDYLVVPFNSHRVHHRIACRLFPQYKNYSPSAFRHK